MPFHSGKSPKARTNGNSLFATFPNASPPLAWVFDLEKNHSFTVALQGEEGDWELGVTSPRGEFYSVARFLSRDDAQDAFQSVQCALLRKGRRFWNIAGPISLFLLTAGLLFAGYLAVFAITHKDEVLASLPRADGTPSIMKLPIMPRDGYAVPADQVLVPPQ